MENKVTIGGIVKTSIVTAFTIAAALIWKDLFSEAIEIFFPQDVLFFKFIAAVIVTILVVIAIYVVLKTEEGAEGIIHDLKNMNKAKRKRVLNEIKKEKAKEELKKASK